MSKFEKTNNQLISENIELKRIEKYLRAEVIELWEHINKLRALPFYNLWIRVAHKLDFKTKFNRKGSGKNLLPKTVAVESQVLSCDFLFIYSSDSQEIGGLKTAGKLARDLLNSEPWNIKGLALHHDPTIKNVDNFFVADLDSKSEIKTVVACGSDTIEKALEISKNFNAKLVLLMMGLDQIFAPSWQQSKNYILAMRKSDLVISLSPHLAKQAKLFGAQNVVIAPLGYDEREYSYLGISKRNKILVTCRIAPEKGLKFVLPALSLLRERGWEVIGFGDLPEHEAAEAFDVFLGRISADELNRQFQDTKFLIDPSWVEGLGLVALEAAACGVIPIITARSDYSGLFAEGDKPFVEIDNFIDPEKLIKTIEDSANWIEPRKLVKSVSTLEWGKGLREATLSLKSLSHDLKD
jgi:glycosyltransferase involved in cell wall biosynthesis